MGKKQLNIILVAILLFSLILNLYSIGFSLNYHFDEIKKVGFIINNAQDFHHPILMLQVVRVLNLFFQFSDVQDVVILGRITTAIFGTLIVFLMYLISRRFCNRKSSLIVALGVAVSPILVIHSHYLKEDIIFAFFALLSILSFLKFIKKQNKFNLIMLGISTGLAIASQYKGILFFIIYLLAPFYLKFGGKFKYGKYYKNILIILLISLGIFLLVNYPLFYDFDSFRIGANLQFNHMLDGHSVVIPALPELFTFHFLNSLIPGMTLLIALFSLIGIIFCLIKWKKIRNGERILIFYVLLFYFITELSPLKPYPDFMRYVIPIVPFMIYFTFKITRIGFNFLNKFDKYRTLTKIIKVFLIILLILTPLIATLKLNYNLNKDTREQVLEWYDENKQIVKVEWYVVSDPDFRYLYEQDITKFQDRNIEFLIASSFSYERFLFGKKLRYSKIDEDYSNPYENLFSYPYVEIKPNYKSFAFSNPTLRIIDIRRNITEPVKLPGPVIPNYEIYFE